MKKLLLVCACAVLIALGGVLAFYGTHREEKKQIGFVIPGEISEEGWNGIHYKAIQSACEELDVSLQVKENVTEYSSKCETVIKEMTEDGLDMIILGSYNYAKQAENIIKNSKDVAFYCASSEYNGDNVTSFFIRMYQARYLAGIVAGSHTQTDKIGYVAAMKNSEVNRGINAFTLGVQRANPDAKVYVTWTDSWDDEKKAREHTRKLVQKVGVDLMFYHQNQPYVVDEAEKLGVYSIGCHEASRGFSEKYLTAAVSDWESVYREIIREYLEGNANHQEHVWLGLEKDAVGLGKYSPLVSEGTKKVVEDASEEIANGFEIFSGEIQDRDGNMRCYEGEVIGDKILLEQMDWYVEGVEFYEE